MVGGGLSFGVWVVWCGARAEQQTGVELHYELYDGSSGSDVTFYVT
jgi:hypothetical protein